MRAIFMIAKNTFSEILRDKILYGFCVFAVFFIVLSLALGQLSFAEQQRITASFGTTALQLSSVMLAILLGAVLLPREIEKKTILTILVRPVKRWQFILGKFLGLFAMIVVVGCGLSLILALVAILAGSSSSIFLIPVVAGVLLESLVMLAVTLLFSTFSRPILVACMSLGIFLIGHWQSTLNSINKSQTDPMIRFVRFVTRFFTPDLDVFNWKAVLIYQEPLAWKTFGLGVLYSGGWFVVFMIITCIIFERKELG